MNEKELGTIWDEIKKLAEEQTTAKEAYQQEVLHRSRLEQELSQALLRSQQNQIEQIADMHANHVQNLMSIINAAAELVKTSLLRDKERIRVKRFEVGEDIKDILKNILAGLERSAERFREPQVPKQPEEVEDVEEVVEEEDSIASAISSLEEAILNDLTQKTFYRSLHPYFQKLILDASPEELSMALTQSNSRIIHSKLGRQWVETFFVYLEALRQEAGSGHFEQGL